MVFLGIFRAILAHGQMLFEEQRDTTPPQLAVTEPSNNSATARRWIDVRGTISDDDRAPHVLINGEWADGISDNCFVYTRYPLTAGVNRIVVTGHDRSGHVSTQIVTVTQDLALDISAPRAVLDLPSGVFCGGTNMWVNGTVDDETAQIVVWVSTSLHTNGPFNMLNVGKLFWGEMALFPGTNQIAALCSDAAGNISTSICCVVSDTSKLLRVTYPTAYKLMNAPSTEVWGVASSVFSNARISVNGQSAYVFSRSNQIGFVTWVPVPLNVDRTMIGVRAELDGVVYYSQ